MTTNPAASDPEVLEMLYWQEGLSMFRIAERLGVSESKIYSEMEKHGIDRRGVGYNSSKNFAKYARYRIKDGYPTWEGKSKSDGFATTFVHQLLLIADGEDPHKVYSDEYSCHHKNGVRWDNRSENLTLWTRERHSRHHANERDLGKKHGTWQEYSDEDLLEWLDSFVEIMGVVPIEEDIYGWPGPVGQTYRQRFGTFNNAVREAGYTPRGEK